jgi:folate-dependent phosphoribosylglycinamide formyltransferase PurN
MMNLIHYARQARAGAYLRPGNLSLTISQVYDLRRNDRHGYTDHDHLLAAADWLKRAQDATGDGGVAGRYHLRDGYTSSYPETTGYIVPTFLRLEEELHEAEFHERAGRAVEFLLRVQLPGGAFPGGEIAENRSEPSPFNTAQIMHGLQAWAKRTSDERCISSLARAGEWLCNIQDRDGAWSRHFYLGVPTTYSAHLTCWLADAGIYLHRDRFLDAASRHLDWVMQWYDAKHDWFDRCGFGEEDHRTRRSVTHTIAYTIAGVLRTAELLGSREAQQAAQAAARAAARRLELSRRLPGILDHRWRGLADFTCLTGNAQMSLIWLAMYRHSGDARLLSAALKAIDIVKRAQPVTHKTPGIRGGIAGSHPVWGNYITHAFPNWAAKYFIDALLAARHALENPLPFPARPQVLHDDIPQELPAVRTQPKPERPRVALLTDARYGDRPASIINSWSEWGFRPDLVLIEQQRSRPLSSRISARLADRPILARATWRSVAGQEEAASADVLAVCHSQRIPAHYVDSVNSEAAVHLVRRLKIDLLIHAGAGIMRQAIIEAAPLGILNAHMALLPAYRGMNVAEWTLWNSDPLGTTVHLIDRGIDTGDILLIRPIARSGIETVTHLRAIVNQAQIDLLGEVVRYVLLTGTMPPRRSQTTEQGLQYFSMHPRLIELLNSRLAGLEAQAST